MIAPTTTTVPPALVAAAAAVFDVPAAAILSHQRGAALDARWAIAYALRAEGWTVVAIGAALDRDHSSICHALQRMEARAIRNPRLALQISALLRR